LSDNGERRLVGTAPTNHDGRTDRPLIGGRPVPIGRYELHFHVADYFRRLDLTLTDPPFLGVVPVQFSVADAEGHYHVPLLATPWSYSTYRGS
jgi:2-oxo-4-hydroxy-4-carboxy-5-ureidoimidazoline decarboxylase